MAAASDAPSLNGLRVLVVEDDALLAMTTEDLLLMHGMQVVGPVPAVGPALDLIARERPAAALLDVNLGASGTSAPVAAALRAMGVPFLVVTGYEDLADAEPALRDAPRLAKPVPIDALLAAMERIFV
jgi:DNA-binding response OmpR family regulator